MQVLVESNLEMNKEKFGVYSFWMMSNERNLKIKKMKILKCIQNALRMIPEAFRHVKRCFQDALGDVECLTASSSPGNQVDGLPGDCS